MKATKVKYPKLFRQLTLALAKEIKRLKIVISKKRFRTNVGWAWPAKRKMKIPIIHDIESIYVIAHEIGHIDLCHSNVTSRNYIQELEAEEYALNWLKKFNIHQLFPQDYKEIRIEAVRYIMDNIYRDLENGMKLKEIHPKAWKFFRYSVKKYSGKQPVTGQKQKKKKRK